MGMFGWLGIIKKSERMPQKLSACIIPVYDTFGVQLEEASCVM